MPLCRCHKNLEMKAVAGMYMAAAGMSNNCDAVAERAVPGVTSHLVTIGVQTRYCSSLAKKRYASDWSSVVAGNV